ncbi:MAG TPA: hypothetical protein VJ302_16780 [Blastocatellia bacterium]|nr:hypothetical protein [Blastocatellia bacterium]
MLWTTGSTLYIGETDGTGIIDITGALTLPADNFWQWVTFAGLAIGVNKATTGDNPVKVDNSGVAAALGGSPPKARYATVWNNRLWLVSATEPNQVVGSDLNNPESWTLPTVNADDAVQIDIDADDGDEITGLWPTKERLFVFKRRSIHRIVPVDPTQPSTDATNLKVEIHAQGGGCVSPHSIKAVLDDVVFLSELGLASLKLAEGVDDFRTALLSRKVSAIQRTPKTTLDIPAIVMDSVSQYWLSIPAAISLTGSPQVFVMDYANVGEQTSQGSSNAIRWVRFNGLAAGTAFTEWVDDAGKVFIIGAQNGDGDWKIFTYRPRDTNQAFTDDGEAYTKQLVTKAYTMDIPLRRKHFHEWAWGLGLWSDSAQIAISYYFDGNESKGGDYSFLLSSGGAGARWDSAIWDSSLWDSAVQVDQDITRKLKCNSSGQRGQNITFVITNAQNLEGIVVKDFNLYWSFLSEKGVNDV